MTKEERRLWYEYLHNYPYRFRRQVAFEILFWIFTVLRQNLQLNWMDHSTMNRLNRYTIGRERSISTVLTFVFFVFQIWMY